MPEYEDLKLFAVFRVFDENEKGFLDIKEYCDCLSNFEPLGLTQKERLFLSLIADTRRNGRIDY